MSEFNENVDLDDLPEAQSPEIVTAAEHPEAALAPPAATTPSEPVPGVDHVPGLPGTPITTHAPKKPKAAPPRRPAAGQSPDAFLDPLKAGEPAVSVNYLYREGDRLWFDGPTGVYSFEVTHCYPNLETAVAQHPGSFRQLLTLSGNKANPSQPYYAGCTPGATANPNVKGKQLGAAQSNLRTTKAKK